MGFKTFTREEANLLFRLMSYRYQGGSLCIMLNKAIKDWPEYRPGARRPQEKMAINPIEKCETGIKT